MRERINITISPDLLREVDEWRGDEDRSAVIERALWALMADSGDDPGDVIRRSLREAMRAARRV